MTEEHEVPLLPMRERRPRRKMERETQAQPATRREADARYRPMSPSRIATGGRLQRLNNLGLLRLEPIPGPPITQQAAHEATLDALYDENELLRVHETDE